MLYSGEKYVARVGSRPTRRIGAPTAKVCDTHGTAWFLHEGANLALAGRGLEIFIFATLPEKIIQEESEDKDGRQGRGHPVGDSNIEVAHALSQIIHQIWSATDSRFSTGIARSADARGCELPGEKLSRPPEIWYGVFTPYSAMARWRESIDWRILKAGRWIWQRVTPPETSAQGNDRIPSNHPIKILQ